MAKNHKSPEFIPQIGKKQQLTETKRILKLKYKLSGGNVFTFSLPGWRFAPLHPLSYDTEGKQWGFNFCCVLFLVVLFVQLIVSKHGKYNVLGKYVCVKLSIRYR